MPVFLFALFQKSRETLHGVQKNSVWNHFCLIGFTDLSGAFQLAIQHFQIPFIFRKYRLQLPIGRFSCFQFLHLLQNLIYLFQIYFFADNT